ncbi:hypothetical protein P2318_05890 [Myxococcaceae bacterium GXIMD 01537]
MSAIRRAWSPVVLAALLSACAGAPRPSTLPTPAPAGPVPEGPVSLRFAWPEGLAAQVTYSSSRLRTGEDAESGESRYRMGVEGAGEALKVVAGDLELPEGQRPKPEEAAAVSIPTTVVSRGGAFLRVEGGDAMLARVDKLLEEQGQGGEQKERVLELLRTALVEGARETWYTQVAGWNGVTLEPGKPLTRQARLSPSSLANVEVPVTETLTYEGAVPCADEETEKRCVRLRLQAAVVESALPGVKAAFLARMKALAGDQNPEPVLEELRVELLTELVTEPGSLIPHRVHTLRRTRVVFVVDKQEKTEDDQREDVEYRFVYAGKK